MEMPQEAENENAEACAEEAKEETEEEPPVTAENTEACESNE